MNLHTIEKMGQGVSFDEVITGQRLEVHYGDPSIDHASAVQVTEQALNMVDPDWHMSVRAIPPAD